jgi:hypothetical protein
MREKELEQDSKQSKKKSKPIAKKPKKTRPPK